MICMKRVHAISRAALRVSIQVTGLAAALAGGISAASAQAVAVKKSVASPKAPTRIVMNWKGYAAPVEVAQYSPDGRILAAGDAKGNVTFREAATGKIIRAFNARIAAVTAIAFAPDGKRFATGGTDKTLTVWDTASGREVYHITIEGAYFDHVAYSPDGKILAASGASPNDIPTNRSILLWDAETGKGRAPLRGHIGLIFSIAFSADSKYLVSASGDKTARIWDLETGTLRLRSGLAKPNDLFRCIFARRNAGGCGRRRPRN